MAKKIIKEAFIMILLLIAIVLIFGVLFYGYIPTNKTIPNKLSYQLPEEIANELKEAEIQETSTVNIIYSIDESELTMYQKSNSYKAGKSNPFVSTATETSNTTTNTTNGGTTDTTNSNSTGTYFNNTGTK